MNETRVRPTPSLPLPRGPEHEAWVVDVTPPEWVRKTWATSQCPYRYTAAGQIVRLSMPPQGYMRYQPLLKRVIDRVERMRASDELPARYIGGDDWTDEERAMLVIATALVEEDTSFVVYNIEPTGRVWFFHRLMRYASWHPDARKGRA